MLFVHSFDSHVKDFALLYALAVDSSIMYTESDGK